MIRCWQCGVEPLGTADVSTLGEGPGSHAIPTGWPLEGARTSVMAVDEASRTLADAIGRAFSVPPQLLTDAIPGQDRADVDHPMLLAIEARRQRQNNGPPERRRVPRRIDPPRR